MKPNDRMHSWYLYTARLKDGTETQRNKLLENLKAKGIGAEAYYVNPINTMPFYRENYGAESVTRDRKSRKTGVLLAGSPCC
jgi:dTDP-4-amino-4,6-dideoxygalactose transaminase